MKMVISWRSILFIGLTWLFIVDGPGACDYLNRPVCNPLIISTCEP